MLTGMVNHVEAFRRAPNISSLEIALPNRRSIERDKIVPFLGSSWTGEASSRDIYILHVINWLHYRHLHAWQIITEIDNPIDRYSNSSLEFNSSTR
jgi:hypothetical protein